MRNLVPDAIILCIIIGTFIIVYFITNILVEFLAADNPRNLTLSQLAEGVSKEYTWALRLIINCIGYSALFIPGILIYKYSKHTHYLERSEQNYLYGIIKSCFADNEKLDTSNHSTQSKTSNRTVTECILLVYCFMGLMVSYLTWGVLQEKIMTKEYVALDGKKKSFFKDSQFLVFSNRFLAFFIALGYLILKRQARHRAPLYKYSYASFSNIMSAWLQYEALKFISFPTQVLAKSCKIIPVMIMGKIISRNKYEFYEYVVAIAISIGMIFFLSGSYDHSKHTPITTLTGLFLLCLYLVFDSFTSNWQSDLFKSYGITSIQMMCGVNLFSALFTASSLFVQGGFREGFEFSANHPSFLLDCVLLSISSTVGQLFIFFTISKFGAVIFTIIMTLRQALAILLSCIIYQHEISPLGIFGIVIVFLAIFIRVYSSHRLRTLRRKHELLKQRLNV
ncbi:CLUMA_CG011095, isoform A [Clunio marinus]|uniref:Adenosine 3'-phospho 5'-phosphosulfate transporter 1 n=1 Tax=Clunio marinus TaxID=568069 RepID=A0A1J1IBY7_9DIPT|nr:CLUMA_CG011095, isoform A [Clunio marinus]